MYREHFSNSGSQVLGVLAQHGQFIAAQSLTLEGAMQKVHGRRVFDGPTPDHLVCIELLEFFTHDGFDLIPLRFGISELLKLRELDYRRRPAA